MSVQGQVYQLICEGACNPNLEAVDQIVADNFVAGDGGLAADVISVQRELRHTPHRLTGQTDRARCQECGAERRYGRTF